MTFVPPEKLLSDSDEDACDLTSGPAVPVSTSQLMLHDEQINYRSTLFPKDTISCLMIGVLYVTM